MNYTQLTIEMYKNGIGIEKIGRILKISTPEVFKILRDKGLLRDNISQRDDKICDLYSNGYMVMAIARKLKMDRHTIVDILKKRGVYDYTSNKEKIDIPEKQERNQLIISLYQSGLSMHQVSKQIGVCAGTVKNVLDHYNIAKRSQHQIGHGKGTTKNRKHNYDLDYFKIIDTEQKAYWLGFLYADGCVHDRGLVTMTLQEKDKDHLLTFKECIGANTVELSYSNKTKSYRFDICSVNIANDLINLGCVPNKSLILKFPTTDQVPTHLLHHFMRGYFDGDGCIYISEKHKNNQCFSILGTRDFLDEYERHLLDGIGRKTPTKRQHKDSWNDNTEQIAYGGKQQIIKIFHFLYKDATIYLERKYDKFNILLPSWDETDSNPKIIRAELSEDHVKPKGSVFESEGVFKTNQQ